jgi:hypothetical protein
MACTVSASAAARKRAAICDSSSASACFAKARYRRLAWDSPANAACKLLMDVLMVRPHGTVWLKTKALSRCHDMTTRHR